MSHSTQSGFNCPPLPPSGATAVLSRTCLPFACLSANDSLLHLFESDAVGVGKFITCPGNPFLGFALIFPRLFPSNAFGVAHICTIEPKFGDFLLVSDGDPFLFQSVAIGVGNNPDSVTLMGRSKVRC